MKAWWKSMAPLWRRLILVCAGVAVFAVTGYAIWAGATPASAGNSTANTSGKDQDELAWLRITAANAAGAPAPDERTQRARQLVEHYGEVKRALCDYHDRTRYPNNSRPLAEQTDQTYPNRPVVEVRPMHATDGSAQPDIQMQSSQSRVYMVSGETVDFTIRAFNTDGTALPMFVTKAVAHGLTFGTQRDIAQVPVDFNGDGGTGENGYSGSLTPLQTNLAGFNGTIRVDVSYNVGDKSGTLSYDVIYSSDTPANWNGPIREAVEDGSLVFHLRANVLMPGRYIVTGRVDDAQGRPVALATFNDMLGQGTQDVKLTVFGKLLTDLAPAFPLTLRDVDGYLLKENTDPDRLLLPRLEGKVYTSKDYPAGAFSDAEWQSEERNRYLTELGKDVDEARDALHRFDPGLERQSLAHQRCEDLK